MRALSSRKAFNNSASADVARRKAPSPVSVRLTWEEHERLLREAGSMTMAAYIRLKLFGEVEASETRKAYTRQQSSPSAELVMIGKMLGALGESEIALNLRRIADAAGSGTLPASDEERASIKDASAAIMDMRERLISALGVKAR